jgi:hypothetical protein
MVAEQSAKNNGAYQHSLEIRLIVKPYQNETLEENHLTNPRFKLINQYKDNGPILSRIFGLYDEPELLADMYFIKPHTYGSDQSFGEWIEARMRKVYGKNI